MSVFVLSASLVHSDSTRACLRLLAQLRSDLGKPAETVLHWSQNVKTHGQRKYVSRKIGGFEELTVISVVVHKSSFRGRAPGYPIM